MNKKRLFDNWPDRYNDWFMTPIGKLVKEYEGAVINEFLQPAIGEKILDAGCGSGIFTLDFLAAGAHVVGLEISLPMLAEARNKTAAYPFFGVQGDILSLPFQNDTFDKVVSVTALEFIEDARGAVEEMFRVTRSGGAVVVASLNSLSPWAFRRIAKVNKEPEHVLKNAFFRSPEELQNIMPYECGIKTAVHFNKEDDPARARQTELQGAAEGLNTGAFVAAVWQKP